MFCLPGLPACFLCPWMGLSTGWEISWVMVMFWNVFWVSVAMPCRVELREEESDKLT